MSQRPLLPIQKTAMTLAVSLEKAVRRFSRYHKYTLGSDLRGTAQRLCCLASRARHAQGAARVGVIDELLLVVEEMKTLLTLAQEIRAFANFNEFAEAAECAVSLGKQSGGWRRRAQSEAFIRQR